MIYYLFFNSLSQRYAADLGRAWPVLVVCGGLAPLVLSVLWLLIVRFFVGVITWITVVLLNVLALGVTIFLYIKGIPIFLCSSPPTDFAIFYVVS